MPSFVEIALIAIAVLLFLAIIAVLLMQSRNRHTSDILLRSQSELARRLFQIAEHNNFEQNIITLALS